jgi:hypothetical protein
VRSLETVNPDSDRIRPVCACRARLTITGSPLRSRDQCCERPSARDVVASN